MWLEGSERENIVGDTVREVRVGWRQIFQGLVDHWEDFDFGEPLEVF